MIALLRLLSSCLPINHQQLAWTVCYVYCVRSSVNLCCAQDSNAEEMLQQGGEQYLHLPPNTAWQL